MSTYSETFTGQTTGSNSTTFTNRYASETSISVENPALGEQDNRVLQFATGDSGVQLQSMDAIDGDSTRDNCEILARFRVTNDALGNFALWARASGSSGSETAYVFRVSATDCNIDRYDSGTPTEVVDGPDMDTASWLATYLGDFGTYMPTGIWIYARFRVNGTGATVTLQARMWPDGVDEPSTWDVDGTDTSGSRITSAGWCGFGRTAHSGTTYLDYFGVGTNGDAAPLIAGTGNIRVTQAGGHVLLQDNTTPVRVTQVTGHALLQNNITPIRVTQVTAHVLMKVTSSSGSNIRAVTVIC